MAPALRVRPDDERISTPSPPPAGDLRITVLAVLSVVVAVAGSLGWTLHRRQVDIQVYLMGARQLRSAALYTLTLPGVHLPFTYPPFSTLFFWPLTWWPTGAATVLWALVNLLALAAIIAVSLLSVHPTAEGGVPWRTVALLLGPAVLVEPVMLDLSFGQINLVLVTLIIVDATTRVSVGGHRVPRGVGIGVAAAIKLVPLIFVPYLILTRQFRAAATAAVTMALCTGAAFALNPSASIAFWTRYVNDQARIGTVTYVSNQSLEGALERVTHHSWSTPSMLMVQAVAAATALAIAWWAWRASSTFFAVLIVADAGLLASPITWAHHMVWVVPALLWLWWGRDRPRGSRWWAWGVAALFYAAPMWWVAHGPRFDTREHGWTLLLANSFTLAALVMLFAAAWVLRRAR